MNNQITGLPRGDIRVSDAERDDAVAELSKHFQAGRLTQEEFEDRSGRAFQARTGRELHGLFTDLPQDAVPASSAAGQAPAGGYARRTGGPSVVRVIIACVVAAIIASNTLINTGHASFGWIIPAAILFFVFVRVGRR